MSDVVAMTGIPPSTIRYYIATGLVPSGHRLAANRHRYDERHVEALRLVTLLKERRGLSVEAIRSVLPDLLALSGDGAFRPEMWDELVAASACPSSHADAGRRLLAAGVEAFTKRGYAEVRVDDVCHAAGVAKGSFYRHFSSKEELYFAVVREVACEAAERFRQLSSEESATVSLEPETAHEILVAALAPHLPLVLDLMALAAQRRPGHGRLLREVFTKLHGVVVGSLAPSSVAEGEEIVARALVTALRRVVVGPVLDEAILVAERAL